MTYEVQTLFGYNWENCWTEDGKPETFPTRKAARQTINEHLADVRDAVKQGYMSEPYHRSNFRVVKAGAA